MAGDDIKLAAGAEEADGGDVVGVGGNLEVVGALDGGSAAYIQRRQSGSQRGVLDADGQGGAGLGADVAAFIGDGGELVVTIRQGGGVQGETQSEVGGAGGEVELVARLEIGKVLIESDLAGQVQDQAGSGSRQQHFDAGGVLAGAAHAQIEPGGAEPARGQVLGDEAVGSLESQAGVDGIGKLVQQVQDGRGDDLVGDAHVDPGAIGFGDGELEPGAD